jgi:xanthosine utilization system XapX-like protein
VSWRKPILFGVSFGLFGLSAGWVQGLLPYSRRWGWTTTTLMSVGAVAEVGLITAQQWRGRASHFNVLAPLDTLMFSLMGVTIAVFGAGLVALAVWAALRLRHPAPTVIAVLAGLGLVLVGSALGGDLMQRGLAYVEANDAVPAAVTIGVAGSGKVAHAVALHGLQVLGLLALLLGRSELRPAARTRAMTCSALGYVALTVLVAAQAYAGLSMLDLSWATGGAIAVAALAVLVPFGVALGDAVLTDRHPAG